MVKRKSKSSVDVEKDEVPASTNDAPEEKATKKKKAQGAEEGEPKKKKKTKLQEEPEENAAVDEECEEKVAKEANQEKEQSFKVEVKWREGDTNRDNLRDVLSKCGETNYFRHTMIGMFWYSTKKEALKAVALNGTELDGGKISVRGMFPMDDSEKQIGKEDEGHTVFVVGLNRYSDKASTHKKFSEFGEITHLHRDTYNTTHQAHITYKTKEAADAAVAFSGTQWDGRTVNVMVHKSKYGDKGVGKGKGKGKVKGKGKGKAKSADLEMEKRRKTEGTDNEFRHADFEYDDDDAAASDADSEVLV